MGDKCYLCGNLAEMRAPHTQSRLWISGIKYTTPCGQEVELSAHMGCLQANQKEGENNG